MRYGQSVESLCTYERIKNKDKGFHGTFFYNLSKFTHSLAHRISLCESEHLAPTKTCNQLCLNLFWGCRELLGLDGLHPNRAGLKILFSQNLRHVATPHRQNGRHQIGRNRWILRFVTAHHRQHGLNLRNSSPLYIQNTLCWYGTSFGRWWETAAETFSAWGHDSEFLYHDDVCEGIFQSQVWSTHSVLPVSTHLRFSGKIKELVFARTKLCLLLSAHRYPQRNPAPQVFLFIPLGQGDDLHLILLLAIKTFSVDDLISMHELVFMFLPETWLESNSCATSR